MSSTTTSAADSPNRRHSLTNPFMSPPVIPFGDKSVGGGEPLKIDRFITDLPYLKGLLAGTSSLTSMVTTSLDHLLSNVPKDKTEVEGKSVDSRRQKAKALVKSWVLVKVRTVIGFVSRTPAIIIGKLETVTLPFALGAYY
jgi:hypothetical protein